MKQSYLLKILIICLIITAVFTVAVFAASNTDIWVNNEKLNISNLSDLYVIGCGDVLPLGDTSEVYALTATGLERLSLEGNEELTETPQPLESEEPVPRPEETPVIKPERVEGGGGGLLSDDGEVSVSIDVIKVGLKYYYSKSRNTTLEEARLENAVGSGYSFGYYDSERRFVELASTNETKLSMRRTSGTGIGVYSTDSGTLLYSVASTSNTSLLGIKPKNYNGEAVTWFKGTQYYGGFEYGVFGDGDITVINVLPFELYIQGVCATEMSTSWHVEALKAQAICARTYAAGYIMKSSYYYSAGFDLTADTYCQAYTGVSRVGDNVIEAVTATEGMCITYNGRTISALYSAADGGGTEDNVNVYGGDYGYLKGVPDPYERYSPAYNPGFLDWSCVFTPSQLAAKSGLKDVVSVIPEYSETGNTISITFISSDGTTNTFKKDQCRTYMGLKSIHYVVTRDDSGNYVFTGSGWGHNVGMSQHGAYAMAYEFGASYKDIIGYYYTGVSISKASYVISALSEPEEAEALVTSNTES